MQISGHLHVCVCIEEDMETRKIFIFVSRYCYQNEEDEFSSEIRVVISSTIEQNPTDSNNNKMRLINGNMQKSIEQNRTFSVIDPWVRRCDQSICKKSISLPSEQQVPRQKLIQYETRPYYRCLSSTSDDCPSPQHRQPLINSIDKDIEYVESRLRGQTTISLPNAYNQTSNWRQTSNRNSPNVTSFNEPKDFNTNIKVQMNGTNVSPKASMKFRSVKSSKRRAEKMKDQKAAKTLRYLSFLFLLHHFQSFLLVLFSLLLSLHGFPIIPTSSSPLSNQISSNEVFRCIGNDLVICYVISIPLSSKSFLP